MRGRRGDQEGWKGARHRGRVVWEETGGVGWGGSPPPLRTRGWGGHPLLLHFYQFLRVPTKAKQTHQNDRCNKKVIQGGPRTPPPPCTSTNAHACTSLHKGDRRRRLPFDPWPRVAMGGRGVRSRVVRHGSRAVRPGGGDGSDSCLGVAASLPGGMAADSEVRGWDDKGGIGAEGAEQCWPVSKRLTRAMRKWHLPS